ncbi:hypothetical protein DICVIV_07758 [Dictyocaulus viviparus]|uniref:Uncharacterized protein n=1 Tax=Dictyocaulus viviparus TaxID=29172 RepID=A0A0D8XR19_DICVI|nr:hypothetical protein DICVIV_07758 [Dictyocaulus viviparus]
MQRRWNAPDGADEPELPVLRGVMPMFPIAPPIRPINQPAARNIRRGIARLRAESPDTAIEYDQNEVEALKRMRGKKVLRAESPDTAIEYDQNEVEALKRMRVNGLALIEQKRDDTSFRVVNDDVRAVREAEERYLEREMDAHLQAIQKGSINGTAILMLMTPLSNYVERIEMELTNTKNLLTDIKARQDDLTNEIEHVEQISQILEKDDQHEKNAEKD